MVKKKSKKGYKVLKILLGVLTVLILAILGYGYTVYNDLQKTANTVHSPIDRNPQVKRSSELDLKGWYYIVSNEEQSNIQSLLKNHLDIK